MLERLLNALDSHRNAVAAATLALLAASVYYSLRLEILDSPERWMPESTRAAWNVFDEHFDVGDTVAIGMHFRRDIQESDLALLRRLRERLATIKGVKAGEPGIRRVYDPSIVAEEIEDVPLLELLAPENHDKYSLYAGALWDQTAPDRPGRMVVTVCELAFDPQEAADDLNARRRAVVPAVYRILNEERATGDWEGVDFHIASGIVMMHELESRARVVAMEFLPLSLAVGLVSLLAAFRSLRTLAVALAASAMAIVLVLGWLGAGGGTLGVVTIATPTLISIIVVASTMHFAAFSTQFGTTGESRKRPKLVGWVAVPCLGAAVTTAIGFRMLGFNDLEPVRDMGSQLFLGALLAFYCTFVATQWIPIRNAAPAGVFTHARLRRYGMAVTRRPWTACLGMAALSALLVFFAWPRPADRAIGLYVDADPFSFFSDEQPIARALRQFSDRKFGVYQLDVVLVPRKPSGAEDAAAVRAREQAQQAAVRQFSDAVVARDDLGVLRVISTDEFRRRQARFMSDLANLAKEQGLGAAVSRSLRLASQSKTFEDTFQSWNRDKLNQGSLRLTFLAHDQGANGFAPLLAFVREQLPEDEFDCHVCGSIAQVVQLGEALVGGIVRGIALSLVIILVLCFALFRSVKLTLLALPPNLFPVLAVYGLMGLFKAPISSGSAMVATIALGIALNDTIHFMLHYRRLTREEGWSSQEAVAQTIDHLGRPIVLTSIVFTAGFLVFLLTDFEPLYHFGVLSSVAMSAALLGDLVMLPNLLLAFDKQPGRERAGNPPPTSAATASTTASPG